MNYKPDIVRAYYESEGLPRPLFEHRFHPVRKWRFDIAFVDQKVFIEVQGGNFRGGRHTRAAALREEYEKLNHAAMMGWRGLYVEPKDVCMLDTVKMIRRALDVG